VFDLNPYFVQLFSAFTIITLVKNKPYDIFGAWFDVGTFISGDLCWRGNLTSCTHLKLNSTDEVRQRIFVFHSVDFPFHISLQNRAKISTHVAAGTRHNVITFVFFSSNRADGTRRAVAVQIL
jgi:hypothetical protein